MLKTNVEDAGPTLDQHWFIGSRLPGNLYKLMGYSQNPAINNTLRLYKFDNTQIM